MEGASPAFRREALLAAALACFAAVTYVGSLTSEYVYDDVPAVRDNPVINGKRPLSEAFVTDHTGRRLDEVGGVQTYRPLAVLVLGLDYRMAGGSARFLHLGNVLWHAAVTALAFLVLARRFGQPVALACCALFATLAAPSEAVHTLVGRADVAGTFFAVLGLHFHAHRKPLFAVLAYALALGFKEIFLVAPVAWLAVDWLAEAEVSWRKRAGRVGAYLVVAVGYLMLRKSLVGSVLVPIISPLANPLVEASTSGRVFGAAHVLLARYLRGVVDPGYRLYNCSYAECLPSSASDAVAWLGLGVVALAIASVFLLRHRIVAASVGLAWFGVFFVPVSNLLITGSSVYGERFLYGPSLGLCLALAGAVAALHLRTRIKPLVVWAPLAAFVLLNAGFLQLRHQEWATDEALFISGVERAPRSTTAQRNAAMAYLKLGDAERALEHARTSVELDPQFAEAHDVLARSLELNGQWSEAQKQYAEALAIGRDAFHANQYVSFLARNGRLQEAADALRSIRQMGIRSAQLEQLEVDIARDLGQRQ